MWARRRRAQALEGMWPVLCPWVLPAWEAMGRAPGAVCFERESQSSGERSWSLCWYGTPGGHWFAHQGKDGQTWLSCEKEAWGRALGKRGFHASQQTSCTGAFS